MSNDTNAHIISVLNMKGGVGKTTIACNLAVELMEKGKKVLVIDIDPQFNTTQTLIKYFTNSISLYNNIKDDNKTIKRIFDGVNNSLVNREHILMSPIHHLEIDGKGLDLIPGDLRLIVDINSSSADKFRSFFNRNELRSNYEYIILDCPPTWGELTSLALSTSTYYLIPTTLDDFSTIGVSILKTQLSDKVDSLDHSLKCLGIVYTFLTKTTAQDGIANRQKPLKKDVEEIFDDMRKTLRTDVDPFSTYFYRDNSFVGESAIYRSPRNIERKPDFAEKAVEFAEEVIDRLDQTK